MLRILSLVIFFVTVQANTFAQKNQQKKAATNSTQDALLWKISGKGLKKPSYLFGTFHLMCKEDIVFPSGLLGCIKSADEVYFEYDMDDAKNFLGSLAALNMKGGAKLKDFYTAEEYKKITTYFKDSLNMPLTFVETMKPMFLQAMFYTKYLTCKKTSGVEEELLGLVKQERKEVKGFETLAEQAAIFDSIPYSLQAKALYEGLDSLEKAKIVFVKMYNLYKQQKLASLEKLMSEEDKEYEKYNYLLLDKRNLNWVAQMKKVMPEKALFMAVGAGHLPGKMGLIQLLQKSGFTVTPVR